MCAETGPSWAISWLFFVLVRGNDPKQVTGKLSHPPAARTATLRV
jgi:hypothetical protein